MRRLGSRTIGEDMRDIDFAGGELAIRACPWALVVYEDQFGRRLAEDFQASAEYLAQTHLVDIVTFTRVLWCLARTADKALPDYQPWMESLPDDALDGVAIDQSDDGLWGQVSLEYMQAFFRAALRAGEARKQRGRANGKTAKRD